MEVPARQAHCPFGSAATGTQRPRAHPRVSQSVGRDGSSWAVRASGGFARKSAARQRNPQGWHCRRGTRLLRQPRHGSLLPSCADVKKAQGNRGPVMPTGATARRKLQTGNGEQSSRHGGALRKRHAASACSLRAGGTHRSDRLIPFGVSSKPGFSGASRARETIDGFGPVDPATGRCSA